MVDNVKKVVLPNGLRILLIPRPGVESVLVEVMIAAGSRNETSANAGVAHFLEHMVFRGTPKWPTEEHLDAALNAVGADSNASTSYDDTSFHVRLAADLLPLAVETLGDIVLRAFIRPEDVDIERGAVLEELAADLDDPGTRAFELMRQMTYSGSSLGCPILGTRKSVKSLGRRQLLEFRARHYRPESTVITVVGKFDESQALTLLEQSFGTWLTLSDQLPEVDKVVESLGPKITTGVDRNLKQSNLEMGFQATGLGYPLRRARTLLNDILGGDSSSRLSTRIRGRRGLAYDISSGVDVYRGAGSWEISAGLNSRRLTKALELIIDELVRLKTDGVTAEELARVKSCLRGQMALDSESTGHYSSYYGSGELHSSGAMPKEEHLRSFDMVTLAEIQQVAREHFRASKLHLAIVGPRHDRREIRRILAKLGE